MHSRSLSVCALVALSVLASFGQSNPVGAIVSLPLPAFQAPVPPSPRDLPFSVTFERALKDRFEAPRGMVKDFAELDFSFLGAEIDPLVIKNGLNWRLDDDSTLNLRSKLTYRYQPKHWPKSFSDLFRKVFIAPVNAFAADHF